MSLPPTLSLAHKTAIVTGGSRGIGRSISVELARRGASVAIVYASADQPALDTVAEIEALGEGAKALAIKADLRGGGLVFGEIVQKVVKAWGRGVDILGGLKHVWFRDGRKGSS